MKTFSGVILSDKMSKTAIVLIERKTRHPMYGKVISQKKKIHARNEIGAKVGQTVKITETKPMAKTVSFKITEILGGKGKIENIVPVITARSPKLKKKAEGKTK